MATKLTPSHTDAGLREIADWGTWFRAAHRDRLEAEPMDESSRRHALDEIDRLTSALVERMRRDYLARPGLHS